MSFFTIDLWNINFRNKMYFHYSFIVIIKRIYLYIIIECIFIIHLLPGGCPRGVMVKAMACGIVVRKFILQSRYYVHFRASTLGKGMNPLTLPAMG